MQKNNKQMEQNTDKTAAHNENEKTVHYYIYGYISFFFSSNLLFS